MELDPITFALEIVNFLVLLWLLQRLLFRPVRTALDARAQATAQQVRDLEQRRGELDARSAELDCRQAQNEAGREAAERHLADEIGAQRQQRLAALTRELAAEREQAHARLEEELRRVRQQSDRELRQRAAGFVADYLKRLASPSIESAVMELFLADLAEQSDSARAAMRMGGDAHVVDVRTAFEPPPALRARIDAQVCELMGGSANTAWRIDPSLLAGICVHLPGHQLEASLRRGVDAFAAEAP
jgi:F-type H+-transporting ATPase subunit b